MQVGLSHVLARCRASAGSTPLDTEADWSAQLSLGEQQRLAVARVLLARPSLALLDEATSALDLQNEARLYKLLVASGMALVSVGHRASLREYHHEVLALRGNGGGCWSMHAACDGTRAAA